MTCPETDSVLCKKKPILGLAGGIGSGKSEVARILASLGAGVIESDELNRAVLNRADVKNTIRSWWGEAVFNADGAVDRGKLAEIVFADEQQRKRLERLGHPKIAEMREARIRQYETDDEIRLIVLDSPLLFEVGLNERCDQVLFVDTPRQTRLQRVLTKRGWTRQEFLQRENSQIPLDTKKEKSDHIVENNTDLTRLRRQVEGAILKILT